MKMETIEEFHKNGQLAYSDQRVYFEKIEEINEDQRRLAIVKEDGSGFYRVGVTKKIFENGQLAWKIDRNKGTAENYRENGEAIQY